MEQRQTDYLKSLIGILDQLHATTAKRRQATIGLLLELAREEAEDILRQAGFEATMQARLEQAQLDAWR